MTVGLTVAWGWWRIANAANGEGTTVTFGIASVDDYLDGNGSAKSREVWGRYEVQVRELAAHGAGIVLLPEKIEVLARSDAETRKAWLSNLAREQHVWLVAGLGVIEQGERRNEAWWFAPDGRLATNYLKHFMAPPEREFVAGSEYPVNDIAGIRYGVAICKDMHFSTLGRTFGTRQASVMLVPAWDFDLDARMAANMTRLRGVESGYTVVRSARNGLLTISDPYGRVLAAERSSPLPGSTLSATVTLGPPLTTLYVRLGDSLGWACVLAALLLTAAAHWRARRARTA